jgi:hypothetical protein
MATVKKKTTTIELPKDGQLITVLSSNRDGYRRAGRAWAKGTTTVPASDFTPEQIVMLKGDARLVVSYVDPKTGVDQKS